MCSEILHPNLHPKFNFTPSHLLKIKFLHINALKKDIPTYLFHTKFNFDLLRIGRVIHTLLIQRGAGFGRGRLGIDVLSF